MKGNRGETVWCWSVALVVAIWSINAAQAGFIGCSFRPEVCRPDEQCIDDNLFGNCQQEGGVIDTFRYVPNGDQLYGLELEIIHLVDDGYSWDDLYTQCILGNVLLSMRTGDAYDTDFCEGHATGGNDVGGSREAMLGEDFLRLLREYIESVRANEDANIDNEVGMPTEKKDEFLSIHKYLKSHKRNDLQDLPNDVVWDENESSPPLEEEKGSNDDELMSQLSENEVALLRKYFNSIGGEGQTDVDAPRKSYTEVLAPSGDSESYEWDAGPASSEGIFGDTVTPEEAAALGRQGGGEEGFLPEEDGGKQDEEVSFEEISDEDSSLLTDLLLGNVKTSDLTSDQVTRVIKYVNEMLLRFKEADDAALPGDTLQSDYPDQQAVIPAKREDTSVVNKEQLNDAVLSSPTGNSEVRVEVAPVSSANQKKTFLKYVIPKPDSRDIDRHDDHFEDSMKPVPTEQSYDILDANFAFLNVKPKLDDGKDADNILVLLEQKLGLEGGSFSEIIVRGNEINFRVNPNSKGMNASAVAASFMSHATYLKNVTGYEITKAGIGRHGQAKYSVFEKNEPKFFVLTFILCGTVAAVVLVIIVVYVVQRHNRSRDKLAQLASAGDGDSVEASKDYQDLCRQHMQSKSSEKPEPLHAIAARVSNVSTSEVCSPSSRSSTSSWSEEPVASNMDISTGHIVLSYMEDHLKNKDRLSMEWEGLCAYEAEPNVMSVGMETANMRKNRYSDVLPYDHSRVVLNNTTNVSGSDYINASTITDHDPRNPAYIATQGPLPHTIADFWQMVWEQGSVVIVNLTCLTENGVAMCHRYWPEEGSDLYHIYEVHLVSEHIWCDDYLVRSFYLKNLQTNETRTVTQFNFLTWPDLGVPSSIKALLDFRRKVNKSYRGRSCPIVTHGSDGVGRTGTYCLLDMVLNRMSKGAKEIDIAATLEHIRDQRMLMVKTKEQFEFTLAAVAEEVHAILKALPQ